ncbi:Ent-kaurene synthase chloroplastic [Euphorbia peplus]|nr:Ent-kaurene synthase chloroplastic [Euphorbia peplus]
MLLASSTSSRFFTKEWEPSNKTFSGSVRAQLSQRVKNIVVTPDQVKESESSGTSLRLKEMLKKVEMPISSYDTAWVAMVPSMEHSRNKPLFPNSLKWVMENQQPDGSWCFDDSNHPWLIKDSLSSTLASVLALKKWNVGQQLIDKGLEYIGSNMWAATDMHQYSPIGFNIIFPSMVEHANKLGLSLSLDHSLFQSMLRNRDMETKSLNGRNMAYVAEGLNGSNNWKEVMKYQRRNGSILNSPATTAAALIHLNDVKCFEYLDSLLTKFQHAVPTLYPFDIYARLCILDELEKLGVDRFVEIEKMLLLDDIYRCWLEGSEEILEDPTCCAMAFRFLRMNGYVVSPDVLQGFEEEEKLFHVKDTKSVLELLKASQLKVSEKEGILDRIYSWATSYLKHQLFNASISDKSLQNEVDYVVKHPHAILRRIENRNYIENYNTKNVSLRKTSFRFVNVDKRSDLLAHSRQDFNKCQIQFKKELAYLSRWEKKYGLDKLKYARQRLEVVYFSIASNLFEPEFSDARLAWTQYAILTTVVDDFFEYAASMDELVNLTNLIERWDEHGSEEFKSKEVEILFYAIYDLVNEDAEKAKKYQGRCIKSHLVHIWIDILKAMLKESEYVRYNIVPTLDEYISNGCTSISFGAILLIPLYFLGKMSEEVVTSKEYQKLYMHISMLGRLLNDRVTSQKDMAQGKLNSVSLRVLHSNGTLTEEEAKEEVDKIIEKHRRELLRMVVQTEGSVVPKACKKLFWMTSKELHLFYMTEDCFTCPTKLLSAVNSTLKDPLLMP